MLWWNADHVPESDPSRLWLAAAALGKAHDASDFDMSEREKTYRRNMKKQVVAARDIPAGTVLAEADLVLKRTSAERDVLYDLGEAIGKRTAGALAAGQPVLKIGVK